MLQKKDDSSKWMFEQFEDTLKQIRAARIGDNGRYVVDAYKADTAMDNKHMVTESPGTNPATKPEFKGLDWFENHKGEWIEFGGLRRSTRWKRTASATPARRWVPFWTSTLRVKVLKITRA